MTATALFVNFVQNEHGVRVAGMKISEDVRRALGEYDKEAWTGYLRKLHEGIERDSQSNNLPILSSFTEEQAQN